MTTTMTAYEGLAAFYRGREDRAGSDELDIATNLRDDQGRGPWVLCWVHDTCEVYAADTAAGTGAVEVLGTLSTAADARRCFDGVELEDGRPGSLSWARLRVRTYEPPEDESRAVQGRDYW